MDQAAASAEGTPHPGVKIALMLAAMILLIIYEKINISQLQSQLVAKQQQVQEIEQEIAKYGSVTSVVQDLIKEKKRLNDQLAVIAQISKKRAFKLMAIKLVQESVLEDLWLSELVVDENVMTFDGLSRTPTSVQQIVQNLNKTEFIERATNKVLKRQRVGNEDLNAFSIEATVKP